MDKSNISKHLYNDTVEQAVRFVESIKTEEELGIYAYNYNWDNGFDVPKAILKNGNCSLSIALMVFHASDGILFLQDKETEDGTAAWKEFISNLYEGILAGKFSSGKLSFDPQLSKVQEYRIKKSLDEKEWIFITSIAGIDCCESL